MTQICGIAAAAASPWTLKSGSELATPVTLNAQLGAQPGCPLKSNRSQFVPEMVHLTDANTAMAEGCTGAMAVRWVLKDVNSDGSLDLVFFFKTQDLDLTMARLACIPFDQAS